MLALTRDEQRHREVCSRGGQAKARKRMHADGHQRAAAAVRWTRDGMGPDERAAEVKRLHAEGVSRWQIAEQVGLSRQRVRVVLGPPTPEEISAARRHAANCFWAARRAAKESDVRPSR